MWGIVPAAGRGSRMQPLAFSKELLPVGSRTDADEDRPVAVSEYLVDRMLLAGVTRLCFVISPGKSDILEYYGGAVGAASVCYVVQNEPAGLCDALFRALPFIGPDEWVCVGLPDTDWFPEQGFAALGDSPFCMIFFPAEQPHLFDADTLDEAGFVRAIEVKAESPKSRWVWGGFKLKGSVLADLHRLWEQPGRRDEYLGTLVNEYVRSGGRVQGVARGRAYVDVGTLHGYREATRLLEAVRLLSDVQLAPREDAEALGRVALRR